MIQAFHQEDLVVELLPTVQYKQVALEHQAKEMLVVVMAESVVYHFLAEEGAVQEQ